MPRKPTRKIEKKKKAAKAAAAGIDAQTRKEFLVELKALEQSHPDPHLRDSPAHVAQMDEQTRKEFLVELNKTLEQSHSPPDSPIRFSRRTPNYTPDRSPNGEYVESPEYVPSSPRYCPQEFGSGD